MKLFGVRTVFLSQLYHYQINQGHGVEVVQCTGFCAGHFLPPKQCFKYIKENETDTIERVFGYIFG